MLKVVLSGFLLSLNPTNVDFLSFTLACRILVNVICYMCCCVATTANPNQVLSSTLLVHIFESVCLSPPACLNCNAILDLSINNCSIDAYCESICILE